MFNQILLEVYCSKGQEDTSVECPCAQTNGECLPTYQCLLNNCRFASFTSHENALCYINDASQADKIMSFGGEMLPEGADEKLAKSLWRKIACDKIEEAYALYMQTIKEQDTK